MQINLLSTSEFLGDYRVTDKCSFYTVATRCILLVNSPWFGGLSYFLQMMKLSCIPISVLVQRKLAQHKSALDEVEVEQ